ncbi:hypothetical protein QOU60_17245, partial [Pseudomonas aeruginosa]
CFIGKLGGWGRGILPNQKVFFRVSLKPDESKRLSIEESDCVPAGFQCPEIHWQDFPTPNFDCSYSTSSQGR